MKMWICSQGEGASGGGIVSLRLTVLIVRNELRVVDMVSVVVTQASQQGRLPPPPPGPPESNAIQLMSGC